MFSREFFKEYDKYIDTKSKKWKDEIIIPEDMRDMLHNADLSDDENLESYDEFKLRYIASFEGDEEMAYDDGVGPNNRYRNANKIFAAGRKPVGKITVGHGFNMDRLEARAEWEEILGNEVSFDDVYKGKVKIDGKQMKRLLKYSIDIRENELTRSYKGVWGKLRANERVAVLSAYYNGPKLVNTQTNFFRNLKKYIETNDPKYLKEAVKELGERSGKDPRLISRRESEATMLDSTKVPTSVKPNEDPTPFGPIKIIIDKTRVILGLEKKFPAVQDSDFIIWRTKLDIDVRDTHMDKEGKVYRKSTLPPKEPGCRCEYIPAPNNLIIVDKNDKMISFNSWIRYGKSSTFKYS